MPEWLRNKIVTAIGVILCLFTLFEVNYSWMQPQSALALFALLGLVACFLYFPWSRRWQHVAALRWVDVGLALAAVMCCGYVIVQMEPLFRPLWVDGRSLGDRVAQVTPSDFLVGVVGLLLVLEAARRTIGWIVPVLALLFLAHSYYCHLSVAHGLPMMPDWMLPHRGQNVGNLVSTTFLQTDGVFGRAMDVMFRYVFLFVLFGAFLEMSGATQFIIQFSRRVFGHSAGGPAKIAVMSSGMMGSLSGSAVANAVTTGAFTIPMMRNAGFKSHHAAAVEAAAGAGGALVPPVMGAGAYMMLEFIQPPVTYLEIVRAAIIPALLYYFSLLMIVHLYARRIGSAERGETPVEATGGPSLRFEGGVFFTALGVLVLLLLAGFSPFRSVTGALAVILVLATLRPSLNVSPMARTLALTAFGMAVAGHQLYLRTWTTYFGHAQTLRHQFESVVESAIIGLFVLLLFGLLHWAWRREMMRAMTDAARNGIPLIAASACVGIIIGVVQQSGIAGDFSAAIKGVVEHNLLLALMGIMVTSIVLGMGVPSVVCYLLIATIMGTLLQELGDDRIIPPLAAHLFIFYFGLMSMVTPPVALAAYAAASIAGADALRASFSAFRFALVGFTLPYMFVYRPVLLLMNPEGGPLGMADLPFLAIGLACAIVGIVALASGLIGYLRTNMGWLSRLLMFLSAVLLLAPNVGGREMGIFVNLAGFVLFAILTTVNFRFQYSTKPPTAR